MELESESEQATRVLTFIHCVISFHWGERMRLFQVIFSDSLSYIGLMPGLWAGGGESRPLHLSFHPSLPSFLSVGSDLYSRVCLHAQRVGHTWATELIPILVFHLGQRLYEGVLLGEGKDSQTLSVIKKVTRTSERLVACPYNFSSKLKVKENAMNDYIDGLPWWLSGKESARQCRRRGFHPWCRNIPSAMGPLSLHAPQLLSQKQTNKYIKLFLKTGYIDNRLNLNCLGQTRVCDSLGDKTDISHNVRWIINAQNKREGLKPYEIQEMNFCSGDGDGAMIQAEAMEAGFLQPSTPSGTVCGILFAGLGSESLPAWTVAGDR